MGVEMRAEGKTKIKLKGQELAIVYRKGGEIELIIPNGCEGKVMPAGMHRLVAVVSRAVADKSFGDMAVLWFDAKLKNMKKNEEGESDLG
jgi:hypothetical protein